MKPRVYDRRKPSRFGTVIAANAQSQAVVWDDAEAPEWRDVDSLGHFPHKDDPESFRERMDRIHGHD